MKIIEVLTGSFFKKTKEELDAGAAAKKKAAGMAGDSKSAKPFSLKDHGRAGGGDYLRRGMKGRRTNYDLAMA